MPRFTKEIIILELDNLVDVQHQDEGKKTLTGKPEWCMVPMEAMEGVVRVFEAGKKTYGGIRTWLPGIRFSLLFSAICRHLFDWFYLGKNKDEKSGQHPLSHVIANALMLLTFIKKERFDDRKHISFDKPMNREAIYGMMVNELAEISQKQGKEK